MERREFRIPWVPYYMVVVSNREALIYGLEGGVYIEEVEMRESRGWELLIRLMGILMVAKVEGKVEEFFFAGECVGGRGSAHEASHASLPDQLVRVSWGYSGEGLPRSYACLGTDI
jgi:hypothetical protein